MKTRNNLKIPESDFLTQIFDFVLIPFMWILGGLKFPLQETHKWHVVDIDRRFLRQKSKVFIEGRKLKAKFDHNSSFGLFHMPIFGGLTKYVAIEVSQFKDHWHVMWQGANEKSDNSQRGVIHKLKIKDKGLKLLLGRRGYNVYAVDDLGNFLPVKIKGYGKIGDGKFKELRLF